MTYRSPHLAFDYVSVRSFDQDGRLRVREANISRACVNPYAGDEIPGWEDLGLDPGRIYMLWRQPDELARAVPTFANVPLLARHVAVSPDDHRPADVVGTLGSDVRFEAPFLKSDLIVWAADSINRVAARTCCELSCGYRYRPIMRPGRTPDGEAYDGIMTAIQGNHCAIVVEGRAGPQCVIGDGQIRPPAYRDFISRFPNAERFV